jgi:hypothetical protein
MSEPITGRVRSCAFQGNHDAHEWQQPDHLPATCPGVAGRSLSPAEVLVKGLRKAVKDDRTEWVDANIVRLLLDRYDSPHEEDDDDES